MDRLSETISGISYILDSLILLRQIQSTGDCNVCACQKECEYVPKPGQTVRYNCPFYKAETVRMAIEALEPQPKKEISYTPEEVQSILIEEGQTHGRKYGFKLGDTIKFSPVEVEKILKSESEEEK